MQYQLFTNSLGQTDAIVLKIEDGVTYYIPNDQSNSDWRAYQAWLAADPENNIPLPAE
jgi:hypothetical protein